MSVFYYSLKEAIFTPNFKSQNMIQRIQSLYLLFITLCSSIFLRTSILTFCENTNSAIILNYNGIIRETGIQTFELNFNVFPLLLLFILIPVISIATIFLFKNRKIQMHLVKMLIIIIIAFIAASGIYGYMIINEYGAVIIPGFKMVIPVLMAVFAFLALMGIRKDDNLVKSYDRLR
jgi:hypothetical protein